MEISHGVRQQQAPSWHRCSRYLAVGGLAANVSGVNSGNSMQKPTKHSIAVLIRKDGLILSTRRPENDDELPGVWGLPAGSFQPGESLQDLIARIGDRKLGVQLTAVRKLGEGTQDRPAYRLWMELWEVDMEGVPSHPQSQWTGMEILKAGRDCGSLCCELALAGLA